MALALLWLFAGTAIWVGAVVIFRSVRRGRTWPTVPGEIVERGVGIRPGSLISPDEPTRATFGYLPHVKYRYVVAGKEYTNDQLYLVGRAYGSGETMRRLVERLPDPVSIHYDPADPQRSYALVTPMWPIWVCIVFGSCAFLCGLLQLLVVLVGQ